MDEACSFLDLCQFFFGKGDFASPFSFEVLGDCCLGEAEEACSFFLGAAVVVEKCFGDVFSYGGEEEPDVNFLRHGVWH